MSNTLLWRAARHAVPPTYIHGAFLLYQRSSLELVSHRQGIMKRGEVQLQLSKVQELHVEDGAREYQPHAYVTVIPTLSSSFVQTPSIP
jgi:hypothetical protein